MILVQQPVDQQALQTQQWSVTPAKLQPAEALTDPPTKAVSKQQPPSKSVSTSGQSEPAQEGDSSSPSSASDSEEDPSAAPNPKVSQSLPIFPSEDVKSYEALVKKITARLGLPLSKPKAHERHDQKRHFISGLTPYDWRSSSNGPTNLGHPSQASTFSKRLDHKYRVQEASASFLYTHPKPNSLVVSHQ